MKAAEMFSLQGRVALVTGASSGLGTQFAKALADNGAAVALVARRAERLAALQGRRSKQRAARPIAIEADVTDRAAVARAFDAAEKAFGTVTILVNNAGIAQSSTRAVEVTPEEWRKVLGLDLDAVFYNAQEAARRMLAAGKKGAIVNIASVLGFGVSKGVAAYATAKAAVVQVTKALAVELAFKGVRVNAIAPGWFVTEINDKYLMGEAGDALKRAIPMGRFGKDGDLDGALLLLAVGRRQLHHRRHHRGRRRPGGDDFRVRKRTMDFTLSPEIEDIRLRVRDFVDEHVLPLEADPENFTEHENIPHERLAPVREKAKKAGLWAPQAPKEYGGMGLPIVAWAAIYEEAARSIFGPLAIHCMAPDDGNMNLLARAGTPAQKDKWLKPIVDGKVRSAFAMTEPHPGSGSDPGMMLTRAEKKGDRYIIRGHKWFITGAEGAAHFILMARTSDEPRRGLTAFLYHKDQPGWRILRRIPIMGPHEHGGHCEIEYDGLEIPEENILLKVGDGLRVDADTARAGAADALHALARLRQALHGNRAGIRRETRRLRQQARQPREHPDQARRGGAPDRDRPAAHHARRLEARPGRPRAQGSLHGQGAGRRHAASGRRRRHPAQRRARLFQGHHPGMDLPLRPLGAARRRRLRGAQDGARPLHARRGARFLEVGLISPLPPRSPAGSRRTPRAPSR